MRNKAGLAAALAAAVALAALACLLRAGRGYELPEGRFAVRLPAGWTLTREADADRREGVYGIVLLAPAEGPGPRTFMAVEYYAPGNSLFPTGKDYLARQQAPTPLDPRGRVLEGLRGMTVEGRPAFAWTARETASTAPNSLLGRAVPVRTERLLVGEGPGFHLLTLTGVESSRDRDDAAFRALSASLRITAGP